jgi:uncharacterized protein YqeY
MHDNKTCHTEDIMTDQQNDFGWSQDMAIPLHEKLKGDLKLAMRTKNADAKTAIRQIMSEYPGLTVPITLESGKKTTRPKKPEEITNDDILDIIRKLVKSEKTVLEAKSEDTSFYLTFLQAYLPKMASKEEIAVWIRENIDFSRFKSPMQAMGPVMKHFGKLADGKEVKEILGSMQA